MTGILIDSKTGDLLLEGGHLAIGRTETQDAEGVLLAQRGDWKEWPLLGGEVREMLGGREDVMWRGRVRGMLRWVGVGRQVEIAINGKTIRL